MVRFFQTRFQLALKINQSWSLSAVSLAGLLERAAEEAVLDGVDPWSDPAVALIIGHMALLAGAYDNKPRELIDRCAAIPKPEYDTPLLLRLMCEGLEGDPRRSDEYALEVEGLLRELANHLGFRRTDYTVIIDPGPDAGDAIAVLDGPWLHLRVCSAWPVPGLGLVYRRPGGVASEERVAPLEALCEPAQLAERICADPSIAVDDDRD